MRTDRASERRAGRGGGGSAADRSDLGGGRRVRGVSSRGPIRSALCTSIGQRQRYRHCHQPTINHSDATATHRHRHGAIPPSRCLRRSDSARSDRMDGDVGVVVCLCLPPPSKWSVRGGVRCAGVHGCALQCGAVRCSAGQRSGCSDRIRAGLAVAGRCRREVECMVSGVSAVAMDEGVAPHRLVAVEASLLLSLHCTALHCSLLADPDRHMRGDEKRPDPTDLQCSAVPAVFRPPHPALHHCINTATSLHGYTTSTAQHSTAHPITRPSIAPTNRLSSFIEPPNFPVSCATRQSVTEQLSMRTSDPSDKTASNTLCDCAFPTP